jgi:hypothetical protein
MVLAGYKVGSTFQLISDQASAAIQALAQAWAEGTLPGGVGTKSAREWAEEAELHADEAALQVASVIPSLQSFAVGAAVQSVDLGNDELHPNSVRVFIDGVYQFSDTWSMTDGVITPASGTWPGDGIVENMEVIIDATSAIVFNVPSNGSVTEEKLDPAFLEALRAGAFFDTVAVAEAATYTTVPDRILTLGYYAVGDGGGATYSGATAVDPSRADTIEITVSGTPYWLFRVHDRGGIDLLQHGLIGGGLVADGDTARFLTALSVAEATGIRKIICRDPRKDFRIVDATITGSVEIDLGGARLSGNFGVENANTQTTILKSSTPSLTITLKNMTIDGGNDGVVPNTSGSGGNPVILFTGSLADINVENVLFTSGGNRNGAVYTSIFDSFYGEFEIKNARRVRVKNSRFTGSPGEVLAIMCSQSSAYNRTLIEIDSCYFDKKREYDANNWSSSSIVVYNAGVGSYVRNCLFGQHIKSAVNWFGNGTIENCKFTGVSDSNAVDFNETGLINSDNNIVRNCFFQNVTGGYAIRSSARNTIIENVAINRCQNGIYIERFSGTVNPVFGGVGSQRNRDIYNVWIKNVVSNGNDVPSELGDSNAINSLIKIKGVSSAQPVYAYISGTGVQNSTADWPTANPEYGIWAENCALYLEGGRYQHGKTAMIYLTGWKNFVARNCQFAPEVGATTHMVLIDAGTIQDVVFEDCVVLTALDAGFSHVRLLTAPTMTGKIYRNRSSTITDITAGYPYVTDYTTTGTT